MTEAMRVLVIEDSLTDAKLVIKELQRMGPPITFERIEMPDALLEALDRGAWDVVLSDWSMPKFSAPEALSILKARRLDLPFIIVSGTIGEETAVEAMRAGAHDFVLKDKLGRLAPAVEREIREAKHRAARREAEDALKESQQRLRDALGVRDEFLAVASHELKTPLTSLSLEVQSAQRFLARDAAAVSLEVLGAKLGRAAFQIIRLTALINNLLEVTSITSGRMVLFAERFDLRTILNDVLAAHREWLARARSTLIVRAVDSLIGTWDPLRLKSVISSVVANAIKYGKGEPIEIDLNIRSEQAHLAICDHGIGIPAEEQERIFRGFERAVPQQHFGGFGLGLWVAREIVEAHGGTITVASNVGAGSTFTVLLPLEREERRSA